MMEDEGCGEHTVEALDEVEPLHDCELALGLQRHDELAGLDASVHLDARQGRQCVRNGGGPTRQAVHHEARDMGFLSHGLWPHVRVFSWALL
jgi:hypothetical protein